MDSLIPLAIGEAAMVSAMALDGDDNFLVRRFRESMEQLTATWESDSKICNDVAPRDKHVLVERRNEGSVATGPAGSNGSRS